MNNELKVIKAEDFGLELDQAKEIETAFVPNRTQAEMLVSEFNEISKLEMSLETSERAGVLIKKLIPIRTSIAKVHKVQKAYFWQGGKMVDAIKNRDTMFIQSMEDALKEKRDHFKNIEAIRIKKILQERTEKLEAVRFDVTTIDESIITNDITFEAVLAKGTAEYNAAIAIEAKAEQDRLAEIEAENIRIEEQRKENVRLKKEAEAQRVKADRLAKIAFDKSEKERKAREKIEKQLAIAREKEQNRLKQIEIEKQIKLSAGDSDKIDMLVAELNKLKEVTFKSEENKLKMKEAKSIIDKLIALFK